MKLGSFRHFLVITVLVVVAGCGKDGGGVPLATTTGVVTYKSAPLSGAFVMAIPEKGPIATGNTDDSGKFTLFSGARSGVAIGKIRVSVRVAEPEPSSTTVPSTGRDNPAEAASSVQEAMLKIVEAQKKQNRKPGKKDQSSSSLAKYADPDTSGLNFEIKSGHNDLEIVLK